MKRLIISLQLMTLICSLQHAYGGTINVPADQSTIIATTTVNANEAEAKLENDLWQSIVRLKNSLDKYEDMKSAMTATDEDREVILRKVCKRMKRDLAKIDTLVTGLDLCLELRGTTNTAKSEYERTKERIKSLNKQIQDLKNDLKTNDASRTVTAVN